MPHGQKTIHTGLKREKILPSALTDFQLAILRVHLTPYRSRATVAAFRVHPTPYRPRAAVAAMSRIATVARAAKVQFPSLVAQRRPSFPVCVPREYKATSRCIASCIGSRMKTSKKVLFTHFGYGLDAIEAGLSLPGLLLLEHPQTTHLP